MLANVDIGRQGRVRKEGGIRTKASRVRERHSTSGGTSMHKKHPCPSSCCSCVSSISDTASVWLNRVCVCVQEKFSCETTRCKQKVCGFELIKLGEKWDR